MFSSSIRRVRTRDIVPLVFVETNEFIDARQIESKIEFSLHNVLL